MDRARISIIQGKCFASSRKVTASKQFLCVTTVHGVCVDGGIASKKPMMALKTLIHIVSTQLNLKGVALTAEDGISNSQRNASQIISVAE